VKLVTAMVKGGRRRGEARAVAKEEYWEELVMSRVRLRKSEACMIATSPKAPSTQKESTLAPHVSVAYSKKQGGTRGVVSS